MLAARTLTTFFVLALFCANSAWSVQCIELLKPTSDQRYREWWYNGGNDVVRSGVTPSSKDRQFLRQLMTEAFEPFFKSAHHIAKDSSQKIVAWLNKNHDLINSIEFVKNSKKGQNSRLTKELSRIAPRHYDYRAELTDIWTREGAKIIRFGLSEDSQPMFRKLIIAFHYISSRLQVDWAQKELEEGRLVLQNHTFTRGHLKSMVDFAFVSYLQALSLLNMSRPKELDGLSDYEWMRMLMAPQEGKRFSLIELVALSFKPAVIGPISIKARYFPNALDYDPETNTLKFSNKMKENIRKQVEMWRSDEAGEISGNLGNGCPAGFCADGSAGPTSLSIFNEVILETVRKIEEEQTVNI